MQQEPPSEAEIEVPISGEEAGGGSVATEDAQGAEDSAAGEEVASDPAESEGDGERVEVERTPEEELAVWKEVAMRAAADLDNFRKRMAREKTEALRYANQSLLEELLSILDNFEMGLQAAAADRESMIFRGMEMVKKQLDDFLKAQGVVEIVSEGRPFDHNLHDAVSQEECPEAEEGTVLRVMRRGFKLHDRLLRPANVVVAKTPEGDAPDQEEGDEE